MLTYVQSTLRGFAYGICTESGKRYVERIIRDDGTQEGIGRAYRIAADGADMLLGAFNRDGRGAFLDWHPRGLPGLLPNRGGAR